MKKGLRGKILLAVLPGLAALVLKLWFATCRSVEHNREFKNATLRSDAASIVTVWHFSIVYVFYHMRKEKGAALVSASADGNYLARFAEKLNFATVRGSSNRRGVGALKELITKLKNGINVAIVADGSQGPPLKAQGGALMMASRTGTPILPLTWSARRYFTVKSWDRTAIPLPFTRIDFFYGEPMSVPAELSVEELEQYRIELENRMLALYEHAWSHQQKQGH
ncbi:MAG: DUF374 domain-containing protein [Desulfobulbaceae bacterium]|nr:MAG: DUF374 domain-containing protein [Desulfobulbaceae bacterium]